MIDCEPFIQGSILHNGKTKGGFKMLKPYDCGLICGRFQTFHIGHESLVETGLKLCDRVLILVGSSQESGTERNPYDVATRMDMLRAIYGNDSDVIMMHGLADLTDENDIRPEWGRYLLDAVDRYLYKAPELMIYGNDESRSRWFDPEDIRDTSEFIVNRGRIPISATMVREAMVFDRRKEWMSMVNPKLHKMYNRLREELMGVPFYQDMLRKGEQK
jgi:cytidyltransferase-like protein